MPIIETAKDNYLKQILNTIHLFSDDKQKIISFSNKNEK